MGKINWGRVLLGGLVAGVVINIVEYVSNVYVFAAQYDAAMKALGVHLVPNAIPMFLAVGFVLGIATIWLYAAVRPRYGAGAATAVVAAIGVWIIGYAIPNFEIWVNGFLPGRLLWIASLVGLVEIIIASVAGAAVYKEA